MDWFRNGSSGLVSGLVSVSIPAIVDLIWSTIGSSCMDYSSCTTDSGGRAVTNWSASLDVSSDWVNSKGIAST